MYAPPAPPGIDTRQRRQRAVVITHLGWEAILLLITVALAVVIPADAFVGDQLWISMASLGLVATGFALSVRTATPNLGVGAIAGLSGLVYAKLLDNDLPLVAAVGLAVLLAAAIGAVTGALVGLTAAPAWAVTLGTLMAAQTATIAIGDGVTPVNLPTGTIESGGMTIVAMIFIVVSVAGGVLWLIPGLSERLSANRRAGGPLTWQPDRLLGALVGMTGSSLLAGVGGVVTAAYLKQASAFGSDRLLPAVAAVLLGGVSVYGGRGGIAGTAIGVALLSLASFGIVSEDWPVYLTFAVTAVAIFVGVVVSRIMEVAAPSPLNAAPARTDELINGGQGQPDYTGVDASGTR